MSTIRKKEYRALVLNHDCKVKDQVQQSYACAVHAHHDVCGQHHELKQVKNQWDDKVITFNDNMKTLVRKQIAKLRLANCTPDPRSPHYR